MRTLVTCQIHCGHVVDKIIIKIKNHKILSLIIVFGLIVIAVGEFTDAIHSIIDLLFFFTELNTEEFSSSKEVEEPPDIPDAPEVPMAVIEYSSQKDASHPASDVVDGDLKTAWVSGLSSPREQHLTLSTEDEILFDISFMQICTASPESQQAAMAVRSVTIYSSEEVEVSPTLSIVGTYEFPQGQTCHLFKFPTPTPLRMLVIQINESAADSSVWISEVTAYGYRHSEDNEAQ